jgi:serine/threonine protein kinase
LASGLKTLHVNRIIHCDLTLANIFISEDGIFKIGEKMFLHNYNYDLGNYEASGVLNTTKTMTAVGTKLNY